jgi:predicted DCC family thiol-disulfide oxidoreductase YuxK
VVTSRVPILVYDGNCGFCTSVAMKISDRWRVPAKASSWQDLGGDGLAELGLTPADGQKAAWWVDSDGRLFEGYLAVAKSLIAAQGWRGAVGKMILIPPVGGVAAVGYRIVVRNRHRLPGSTNACRT